MSGRRVLAAAWIALLPLALQLAVADEAPAPHYPDGAASFQANCVVCHGHDGIGQPSLAPPLTTYPARYIADPEGRRQLIMTVLYGMYGDVVVDQKHYNFKMPDFARFTDDSLAALLNYVVFDIAQASATAMPIAPTEIAAERTQVATGEAVRQHRSALLSALGM